MGLTLLAWVASTATGFSQEPATRADADRQRREEKAGEVRSYEPNGLERAMTFAEDKAIFIVDREGFYPKLGSLTTGSGFAYGVGFRDRDLFKNRGSIDIWTAGSTRRYWAAEARLTFPELAGRRLLLETWVSRRDYPQENFFGLGPDSDRDDRSGLCDPHRLSSAGGQAFGRILVRARRRRRRVSDAGRRQRQGRRRAEPGGRVSSRRTCRLRRPARTSSGRSCSSRSTIASRRTRGRADGTASTSPTTTTARPGSIHLQPLRRRRPAVRRIPCRPARRRRAARGLDVDHRRTATRMPFYYMPTLGGNDTLRGFREYRFRGPHAILAAGRVSLGDLERARRRPVLRRGQGRRPPRRSELRGSSRPTTASDSASTPTARSSAGSMPDSGAVMASTSTSCWGGVF